MEEIISGIKTFYYKAGQGRRNIVFLHGWGTDHTSFLPVIEKIKNRYTVFAPDLPGFGGTDEPLSVYDTKDYAGFVKEFIKKLEIEEPVIIGHSNGGRIAIVLSQMIDIDKMILVDSAGMKPARNLGYYLRIYTYKAVKKLLLLFGNKGKKIFARYRKNKGSDDYRLATDKMKAVMNKVVNEDLQNVLPDITASTLLYWGEKDTATPISDAKLMNSLIKGSGIVTVKNGGHYSYLDDVNLFVRVLNKFLEE